MAETADMLTAKEQVVVLPDMRAGCSMADMANMRQTNRAWEELTKRFGDTIIPLTYVNSTAEIKAFKQKRGSGRHIVKCETHSDMGAHAKGEDFISSRSASRTQYCV